MPKILSRPKVAAYRPVGGSAPRAHKEYRGVIAQLVERLNGIEEVWGSNPHGSTFQF